MVADRYTFFKLMYLDPRKQQILGAVVRHYVETVRPVGSEDLATKYAWGVKSATIRNELAELSDMGFLRQPHTSAGRIPSDQGYRFYVDHLLIERCPESTAETDPSASKPPNELEMILRETCSLLSKVTSYTSVATPPRVDHMAVSNVFLARTGDDRILVTILLSSGQAVNRLVAHIPRISNQDMATIDEIANAEFGNQRIRSCNTTPPTVPKFIGLSQQSQIAADAILSAAHDLLSTLLGDENLVLEGTSEILRQPEFRDIDKFEMMLNTFSQGQIIFRSLAQEISPDDVTVVIGSEHNVPSMHECSMVTATYYMGTQETGAIGVIGPTRMDYDRAVPAVGFYAKSLTDILTRLHLA